MNIRFFITLVIISTAFLIHCDNEDLYTYVKNSTHGPYFKTFSINGVSSSINISAKKIYLNLPEGTDLTSLIPMFTIFGDRVEYNSTVVEIGVTTINFSSPIVMSVMFDSGITNNYTVTVTEGVQLVSLSVYPSANTVEVDATLTCEAYANYSDGTSLDVTSGAGTVWSSSDNSVATVTDTGAGIVITGIAPGTVDIVAFYGTLKGTTSITVTSAPVTVESITVATNPYTGAPSIEAGSAVQFEATVTYSDSNSVVFTSGVNWYSGDGTIATIDESGLATGISFGNTVIYAELDGITSPDASLDVTQSIIYVTTGGTDPYYGTQACPVAGIDAGLARAAVTGATAVHVQEGSYSGPVYLQDGISLLGSWDAAFSARNVDTTPSTVTTTDGTTGVIYLDGTITTETIVDSFALEGISTYFNSYTVNINNTNYAADLIIERCRITGGNSTNNSSYCVSIYGSQVTLRNNIIIGSPDAGDPSYGIYINTSSNVNIFNNTIDAGSNAAGPRYCIGLSEASPSIMNNIFYVSDAGGTASTPIYEAYASSNPSVLDTNILYTDNTSADYLYYDYDYNYLYNAADISAYSGITTLSTIITDAPLFVDRPNGNYTLTNPGSPAIDTGIDLSSYGFFTDINGINRNTTGTGDWSIGAYEY